MKRRQPLKAKGRRAAREVDALYAFRDEVRSRVWCERCAEHGEQVYGQDAHHMRRNPRKHDAALGAFLCSPCHRAIHDHTVDDWQRWFK